VESLRVEIEKVWWQPLLKVLQDAFVIVPKAALPTKEKEALKKAFGSFNAAFEQVLDVALTMNAVYTCPRSFMENFDTVRNLSSHSRHRSSLS
jgi:hypothetical protein